MIVTVFGSNGMLGKAVCDELAKIQASVIAVTRRQGDIGNQDFILRVTQSSDYIINCAGVRPGVKPPAEMLFVNSVVPYAIATSCSQPIIHISTDCVFSGYQYNRNYFTADMPTPIDLYGRSKLAGEVNAPHVTNVRTSFIGRNHGLLRWLIDNANNEILGYTNTRWSGSTVQAVARAIIAMLGTNTQRIEHLATEQWLSKYEVLKFCNNALELNAKIQPIDHPHINRALVPTVVLESIFESVDDLYA